MFAAETGVGVVGGWGAVDLRQKEHARPLSEEDYTGAGKDLSNFLQGVGYGKRLLYILRC